MSVEDWLTDLRSHSYVIGLNVADRARLLTAARSMLDQAFPTTTMAVRYETRVWIARRV